jgi:hypothetical protein
VNRTEVQTILDTLTDKGMLTQLSQRPRRYAPVAPETALEAHLARREEELRQARAAVADMSNRYRAVPRQTATDELAEIVTGKRRTWQRMPLGRDRLRSDGLLVVHPCALLDALSALFELVWDNALPLSLDTTAQDDGQPMALRNPTTRTVLILKALDHDKKIFLCLTASPLAASFPKWGNQLCRHRRGATGHGNSASSQV